MSIFLQGLEEVYNGETFHIDFEQRTLKVGQHKLIEGGEYDASKVLYNEEFNNPESLLDRVRELYITYKFSLPSERSDKKRRKYFKALPIDELTDEQLLCGTRREVAQYMLEAFVLCAILNGDFVWNDCFPETWWFYNDPKEQDLVFLKEWFVNK